jgi:hypothetical protein
MKPETQPDPFTLHASESPANEVARAVPAHAVESAWFDAPRRSSRPPRSAPPPPIDDAVADAWFR